MVKNLLTIQETWVRTLGWEDPMKKKMATYSSILDWEIPWTEEPGGTGLSDWPFHLLHGYEDESKHPSLPVVDIWGLSGKFSLFFAKGTEKSPPALSMSMWGTIFLTYYGRGQNRQITWRCWAFWQLKPKWEKIRYLACLGRSAVGLFPIRQESKCRQWIRASGLGV